MASAVDIVNVALTLLGESRIMNLTDNTKPAREANAVYEHVRDALLGGYNWSFAKTRAQLPALSDAPAFGFSYQYQIPNDCLRLVFIGDVYVGVDLTDYRGAPSSEYEIEGRKILTDWSAPLNVKYIKRVEDPSLHSVNFNATLSAKLAESLAESLTQSAQKREQAKEEFGRYIREAIRANAIELPPQKFADDEWMMSRL